MKKAGHTRPATFILFMFDKDGIEFKIAGMSALTMKIMEFILRFVN